MGSALPLTRPSSTKENPDEEARASRLAASSSARRLWWGRSRRSGGRHRDRAAVDAFDKQHLGELLFNDTTLSEPAGQSCATCHDPSNAFIDGRRQVTPTSQGAVAGFFGVRNTPSIVYASYIAGRSAPPATRPATQAACSGTAGPPRWKIQAGGPVLNPIEMGNPDKATRGEQGEAGPYASKFKKVFGANAFADPDQAFTNMTQAIATFERQGMPNRFTSKYDAYLAGKATLTDSEARGLALFKDPKSGGGRVPDPAAHLCGCAQCHLDKPAADGTPPLFTDFGYDNIGVPKNPNNGYYNLPAGA